MAEPIIPDTSNPTHEELLKLAEADARLTSNHPHCNATCDVKRRILLALGYVALSAKLQDAEQHSGQLEVRLEEQRQHFCVRCHHRWQGDTAVSYCGDCHRECQALNTKLQDVQADRDACLRDCGQLPPKGPKA